MDSNTGKRHRLHYTSSKFFQGEDASQVHYCYGPYVDSGEDDKSVVEKNPFTGKESRIQYVYRPRTETGSASTMGQLATYSGAGYVVDLPMVRALEPLQKV